MAEIVGLVASSLALAEVAIKVGGTVTKLKRLWDEIQDVPQTIVDHMKQIEIADSIIWEMENEMKEHAKMNPTVTQDIVMRNSIELCRQALQSLVDLVDDLRAQINAQKKMKKRIAKVKVCLKKELLVEHERRLQNAFSLLYAARQSYMM